MEIKFKKISPSIFFLMVSLLFGLIFIFLTPPFQSPDESSHVFRAAHIFNGHLMGNKQMQRLGGELDEAYLVYSKKYEGLRFSNDKMSYDEHKVHSRNSHLTGKSIFVDFPNTAYFSPIVYLPHTMGLAIGSLSNRVSVKLYLMRIMNLLVWIALVFYSIKIMPVQKWTLTFLALLPSAIFLHASANGDAITNGLSFLLIAICWQLIFSIKPERKIHIYCFIIILMLIILTNKVVYGLLIALIILIPKNNFPQKINKNLFVISAALLFLLAFTFWYNIVDDLFISYDQYDPDYKEGLQINPGVDPMEQLSTVLNKPLNFLGVLFLSYWDSSFASLAHYIGKFGWGKNYLPTFFIALHLILISLVAFFDKNDRKIDSQKYVIPFLIILGLGLMFVFSLLMYMQWNAVGSERISNLSGRYFIPIFPLFFLSLGLVKWNPFAAKQGIEFEKIKFLYQLAVLLCFLVAVFCFINRFWK